jgi:hypothetical protein
MSVFFVSSSESSHGPKDSRTESLVEVVLASGAGVVALVVHFVRACVLSEVGLLLVASGIGGGDVGVCIEVVEVSRENFGSGCAKVSTFEWWRSVE